jgi:predicted AAA+ superfamily ATPase
MNQYIQRNIEAELRLGLEQFPVVAILGSRQCGKSTLAKKMIQKMGPSVYLDLEITSDLSKLNDPEAFLRANEEKLVCLDEIQRVPEIFPVIRGLTDITRRPGQILVLGSASPDLLKQTSESLAGRIDYLDLTPFLLVELPDGSMPRHWLRGGYPDSFLASSGSGSWRWRRNMIRTYLEQDIPNFGFNISTQTLQRLWMMLAHTSGQLLNTAKLSESLGVSRTTVSFYIDILEKTYMVRILRPLFTNLKKRLVKSPKVYLRDSGLMHHLLGVEDQNSLLGHPSYGGSWETYALEQICSMMGCSWMPFFYRTSNGAEIDLVLEKGLRRVAVEFKASSAPKPTRGLYHAMQDLGITEAYIVAPLPEETTYPAREGVTVTTVAQLPGLIGL